MARPKNFVAKVVNGGRITIPKDARIDLGIHDGDYVHVAIEKLDLFKSSIGRLLAPRENWSVVARQLSATHFSAVERSGT